MSALFATASLLFSMHAPKGPVRKFDRAELKLCGDSGPGKECLDGPYYWSRNLTVPCTTDSDCEYKNPQIEACTSAMECAMNNPLIDTRHHSTGDPKLDALLESAQEACAGETPFVEDDRRCVLAELDEIKSEAK